MVYGPYHFRISGQLIYIDSLNVGRVVNTPASYLGGPVFISARRLDILTKGFRDFSQSFQANAETIP
jgi:hypothetical protein